MRTLLIALVLALSSGPALAQQIRVRDLGHFLGWRDNALVGYGIVTGLSGSGDSPKSEATRQALRNVLSRFGSNLTPEQIRSRNVAVVMIMATYPPSANIGDKIDVSVSSVGDARSLLGGYLLMTPLLGADQRPYALAQGPLIVGGYRFDSNENSEQRNHPTSGLVPNGATIETTVETNVLGGQSELTFVLKDPNVTTAQRLAQAINGSLGAGVARVRDANAVNINVSATGAEPYAVISKIENLSITPDDAARIVVNERSGTVVAGGAVRISSVVISQGDVRVSVVQENQGSQPFLVSGYVPEAQGMIVTNTRIAVSEPSRDAVIRLPSTTVADLVTALNRVHINTREMIAILQAIKSAGALHADIVVQ